MSDDPSKQPVVIQAGTALKAPSGAPVPPDGGPRVPQSPDAAAPPGDVRQIRRRSAVQAMERLRDDFLTVAHDQMGRESAMMEMVVVVDTILTAALKALEQAQQVTDERITAELESVRGRLAGFVRDREQEDLAMRDELAKTKRQLADALEALATAPRTKPQDLSNLRAQNERPPQ